MANESSDATERKEDLLHSIEEDEETLREAVHELAEATEQTLDVAQHIRNNPLAWVGGAFCVGLWLGMSGKSDARQGLADYRSIGR